MLRYLGVIGLPLLLLATPASAVSYKQKMETCKIGADSQKLAGKQREVFIHKCMGKGDYEPAARKEMMKDEKAMKKPAKKKAAMKKPAMKPAASAEPKQQ
jgi:hypothetical protein